MKTLGYIVLLIVVFFIGWKVAPAVYNMIYPPKPAVTPQPTTITINHLYEDTTKVHSLSAKVASLLGFKRLYEDLFAKFVDLKPESIYIDTTKEPISLAMRFIVKVSRRDKKITVWNVELINSGSTDFEGLVDRIKSVIVGVLDKNGLCSIDAQKQGTVFAIPENADYDLYATMNTPKLILHNKIPLNLYLFGGGSEILIPTTSTRLKLGTDLRWKNLDINGYYETYDRIGIEVRYNIKLF